MAFKANICLKQTFKNILYSLSSLDDTSVDIEFAIEFMYILLNLVLINRQRDEVNGY